MPLAASAAAEAAIDARWREWEPWALLAAKRGGAAALPVAEARDLHRSRAATLLAARISWRTIRLRALDDPRRPTPDFEFLLRKFGHYSRAQQRRYAHGNGPRNRRTVAERRAQTAP